jgi:hypothetical protein
MEPLLTLPWLCCTCLSLQALLLAGDGDVVLLAPGRYLLNAEASHMRRSIRVIGMGVTQQVRKEGLV